MDVAQPSQRIQILLFVALFHNHKKIQVRIRVQAVELQPDRAQPDQGQGVSASLQGLSNVIEPFQQMLRVHVLRVLPAMTEFPGDA